MTTIPGTRTHSIPHRCKRRWDTGAVDGVWVSDIPPQAGGAPTYLRTHQGWVCPGGIKDACSRTVISTAMDTTMTTDLVEWALRRARALRG